MQSIGNQDQNDQVGVPHGEQSSPPEEHKETPIPHSTNDPSTPDSNMTSQYSQGSPMDVSLTDTTTEGAISLPPPTDEHEAPYSSLNSAPSASIIPTPQADDTISATTLDEPMSENDESDNHNDEHSPVNHSGVKRSSDDESPTDPAKRSKSDPEELESHKNSSDKPDTVNDKIGDDLEQSSSNRDLEQSSSNRDLGQSSSDRDLEQSSSNRDLEQSSSNRDLGQSSSNRDLEQSSSNRDLGQSSSNRDLDDSSKECIKDSSANDKPDNEDNVNSTAGSNALAGNNQNTTDSANESTQSSVEAGTKLDSSKDPNPAVTSGAVVQEKVTIIDLTDKNTPNSTGVVNDASSGSHSTNGDETPAKDSDKNDKDTGKDDGGQASVNPKPKQAGTHPLEDPSDTNPQDKDTSQHGRKRSRSSAENSEPPLKKTQDSKQPQSDKVVETDSTSKVPSVPPVKNSTNDGDDQEFKTPSSPSLSESSPEGRSFIAEEEPNTYSQEEKDPNNLNALVVGTSTSHSGKV